MTQNALKTVQKTNNNAEKSFILPHNVEAEQALLGALLEDNKIIDNEKVKKTLNYQLTFPSYKEGLRKIFNDL